MLFFYLFVVSFGVVVGFVGFLVFLCVCALFFLVCVCFLFCFFKFLFCLYVWVFLWGVVRLFVGLLGEDVCSFWGFFRVIVCADVKINTIVKFKNVYILQLLSTL